MILYLKTITTKKQKAGRWVGRREGRKEGRQAGWLLLGTLGMRVCSN